MRKLLTSLALFFLLIGCTPKVETTPPDSTPVAQLVVKDFTGKTYRLISPDVTNANGAVTTELWERIDPPDTNHWYTRTLNSRMFTNEIPLFNSLSR